MALLRVQLQAMTQAPAPKYPWLSRLFWLVLLAALLFWALQNAPLAEIWNSLNLLRWWQIGLLLGLNGVIFALIIARWWLIVRAEAPRVPFRALLVYRLAAFGMSYFTPGPQVGGEPLQILYLKNGYGLTTVRATAAVLMDKLLEFLANFLFLALGLFVVGASGMLGRFAPAAWAAVPLGLILLWPLAHIALMYHGIHPLAILFSFFDRHQATQNSQKPETASAALSQKIRAFSRLIIISERLAALFCRRHLASLLAAVGVSLLSWAGMLFEYHLMLTFLSVNLSLPETLAALTVVRLSFLAPLPAGLGALEASQVFAVSALGLPAALGISLSLLMRGRDLLLGGLGLLIAALKK